MNIEYRLKVSVGSNWFKITVHDLFHSTRIDKRKGCKAIKWPIWLTMCVDILDTSLQTVRFEISMDMMNGTIPSISIQNCFC